MNVYKLNNGYEIPCIGYGTYPQKETLEANVPIAVQYGYQLIDASDNYYNEFFIGNGIKKADQCLRKEVIVISKFSQPRRTGKMNQCFEESREKLDGQINIYLLHWPYPFLWKKQWKKMEDLYLQGKCQAIGVCNFEEKHLRKLLQNCRVKPMINQYERHPMFQQQELTDFCKNHGIQVMSYSPVARMDKRIINNQILEDIAKKYKKTVTQVILRWNIEQGCIPIPASSSESHIRENIQLFDFSLAKEEIDRINSLEEGHRIRFDPNKRFNLKDKIKFFIYSFFC